MTQTTKREAAFLANYKKLLDTIIALYKKRHISETGLNKLREVLSEPI